MDNKNDNDITIAELNRIFKNMDDNNKEGVLFSTKDWVSLLIEQGEVSEEDADEKIDE